MSLILSQRPNYMIYPYGLWLPNDDPKLIERIWVGGRLYVRPQDGIPDQLWINNKRVRTAKDGSSRPCINCGHYIDNGHTIYCDNVKCKRERKDLGLCEKQYSTNQTWIHKFVHRYSLNRKQKLYTEAICEWCNQKGRWLSDITEVRERGSLWKPPRITNRVSFSGKFRHTLFKMYNFRCAECGANKDQTTLHIDHKKPISKGGTNELSNLQVLCQTCNLSKHTDEWEAGK